MNLLKVRRVQPFAVLGTYTLEEKAMILDDYIMSIFGATVAAGCIALTAFILNVIETED
ncbi:MAG: hypothetical protein VCC00_00290 [Deltaproteobacteria bacterium]